MSTKEKVLTALAGLPDDASYEDMLYRLQLLRKIEIGLREADEGNVISHEEFMKELFGDEYLIED